MIKVIDDFQKGKITLREFVIRLDNLGYTRQERGHIYRGLIAHNKLMQEHGE